MAAVRIIVKKQSLIDWEVTGADGKHVAWIRRPRDRIGYDVILRCYPMADYKTFAVDFAHAKTVVRDWLAYDTKPTA